MLCSACGMKVQFRRGALICAKCDAEFDAFDFEEELVPEPVFVTVRLSSGYAIIDTRKQQVYVVFDANEKAELVSRLLNKNLAQLELNKQISKHI